MGRLRLRAYAAIAYPWLWVKRFVLWRLIGRPWRSRVDDHLDLGSLLFPGDVEALSREGVRGVVSLCAEFDDPVERLRAAGLRGCFVRRSRSHQAARRSEEGPERSSHERSQWRHLASR